MTYQIIFTATTVTVRKGRIGVRSSTNPDLIGAYASIYALHGEAALPRLWLDIAGIAPAKAQPVPVMNAATTSMTPFPPTGCAYAVPDCGPTMQRRGVHLDHLRASGFETQYRSRDYYVK